MLFRCLNPDCPARLEPLLQPYEFWANAPACPECGANAQELVVTHFSPMDKHGKRATGFLACTPTKIIGGPGASATGVPDVVNCPLCRETPAWKKAAGVVEVPMSPEPVLVKA